MKIGVPTAPATAPMNLADVEPVNRLSMPEQMYQNSAEAVASGVFGFGRNVLEDLSLQFRAPLGYASRNPLKFTAGAAGLLALIATDHITYSALTDFSEGTTQGHMQQVSASGDGRNGLYLVAGIGLAGIITGSSREKTTSIVLAEALLTSAFWTGAIKSVTGRERPREKEERRSDWEGPAFWNDDKSEQVTLRSFPSGHSTGAWATAAVLAHRYPAKGIVPTLAYASATAISYSRLAVGAHWLSDVLMGALIGVGSARVVLSASERRANRSPEKTGLRLGVDASSNYKGIHIKYDF
ncbi:MAG: phosphatase PAP2 family protein [Planctomycetota bacterium]